ncbi:hypothetical protein [Nostoc sp. MG11]|uniref:hypothetical protein n=1 Tax=Nostoc sp. MG11 TaxID=2721166 RepID=UPI001868D25B|nr:hypothetical protein [Nostoc sp. MG11]
MAFDGKNLTLADVKLLIYPKFANILRNPRLVSVLGATARIDTHVAPYVAVPEPENVLTTLLAGAALLVTRFCIQKIKCT